MGNTCGNRSAGNCWLPGLALVLAFGLGVNVGLFDSIRNHFVGDFSPRVREGLGIREPYNWMEELTDPKPVDPRTMPKNWTFGFRDTMTLGALTTMYEQSQWDRAWILGAILSLDSGLVILYAGKDLPALGASVTGQSQVDFFNSITSTPRYYPFRPRLYERGDLFRVSSPQSLTRVVQGTLHFHVPGRLGDT